MKSNRYYIIAVAAIMSTIFASCRQELCYNHFPSADIKLSWERVWERDYGRAWAEQWDDGTYGFKYSTLAPDMPEWVNLVKFNDEQYSDEFFLTTRGGNIRIDNSTDRSFLLYNGDTEYIVLEDMASLSDARATTTSRSRSSLQYLQSLGPDMRSVNPPDLLYAAFIDELPQVGPHQTARMPVKMQPLVYTYIIRYEFEYGLQHVALARGAIGGMAESVYLRNGVTSDESAILLYDCVLTDYGCEAHVRSFGVPAFPDRYYGRAADEYNIPPVVVNLELRLKNGNTVEYNIDVSDQMMDQPRGGIIRVRNIRVEDRENQSDSGFDVDLTGWGDPINIELPI